QGRVGGGGNSYGSNVKPSLLPLPSSNLNWRNKPNTPTVNPIKKQMTQKEYQEKRAHNLCFYYDQKYTPGYKCSGQLYSIVLLADEELEANSFQTMRITRKIRKHEVHILVDCGATHNFLDVNVAKQVGCKTNKTYPLEVAVGGGRKLISNAVCKNFELQLQGETFYIDMMILPLGGCEMVLGIQWLATLGDIKCNFNKLRMEFMYKNKKMTLRDTPKAEI
ncbi:gypsy/ty3 retroelement polyprotein, partial [Tanacetum coccineum]